MERPRIKAFPTMKKLILSFFVFYIPLHLLGQNGLQGGRYFLLLKDEKTVSVNTFDTEIKEIKTYPINKNSLFTTDQKQRIAILDTANNILIYNIETETVVKLPIPFKIEPKTILLNDDNLFVGGEAEKDILIQYHLKTNKWHQLKIPKEVKRKRAIDDLVVNDSLLIAIDNVIFPKYILFFRLNSTEKLAFSHLQKVKSNGAYEEIHQGRITNNYLGLISYAYGDMGYAENIAIYNNMELTKCFSISAETKRDGRNGYPILNFNDFLLIGNKLFIANKEKGLGLFEIKNSYFRVRNYNAAVRVSEEKVNYKAYEDEEIIKLTKIPNNETKIILTIRDKNGKIRQEVVEIYNN